MSGSVMAAALRLEEEIRRLLGGFALEHADLIRSACQVDASVTDLIPVVITTVYGHTLVELDKRHGRAHVERLTELLLEAQAIAKKGRDSALEPVVAEVFGAPARKDMH